MSRALVLIALLSALVGTAQYTVAAAKGKRPAKPPRAESSFTDHLNSYDASRWSKADGWANGPPFDNAWNADNVTFPDGAMELLLNNTPQLGEPYTSGEYRTQGYHGYGCFETSMKPAAGAGLVTSFFTFAGPWDNGGNGRHNEIDVEFPGRTDHVQFNYWTNDDDYTSSNEYLFPLGFDAAADYHHYAFKWTSDSIAWYIDGNLIYEVFDSPQVPIPKADESLQKIMMNLWAVDEAGELWAGTFVYPGSPVTASYEWVRYSAGEDCEIGPSPDEPEPPAPADGLYVAAVDVSFNSRATQAIVRVTVLDETGRPASGVNVSGLWSGLVSKGDTQRVSDDDGVATFFSARFRTSGQVEFCVTDLARADITYAPDANVVTCGNAAND